MLDSALFGIHCVCLFLSGPWKERNRAMLHSVKVINPLLYTVKVMFIRGSLGLLCVCVSVPSTACKWEHEVASEIVCGQQKDNQLSGQAVTKCPCQGCHLCCSHLQTKWCHSWSRSLHFARCYLIFVVHFQRYRCNTDTRELWGLAPSPTSHVEERIAGQGKGRDPWEEVIAALILPGLCSAVVQLFPPTHSQAFPM